MFLESHLVFVAFLIKNRDIYQMLLSCQWTWMSHILGGRKERKKNVNRQAEQLLARRKHLQSEHLYWQNPVHEQRLSSQEWFNGYQPPSFDVPLCAGAIFSSFPLTIQQYLNCLTIKNKIKKRVGTNECFLESVCFSKISIPFC